MKKNIILLILLLNSLFGNSQLIVLTPASNPYRLGLKGGWREQGVYNYYTQRHNSGSKTDIRKEGYYDKFINPLKNLKSVYTLDFTDPNLVEESEVLTHSSSGAIQESIDILKRISSVKYGFIESLPLIVGSNANKEDLLYESFEEYNLLSNVAEYDYSSFIDDDFNFYKSKSYITDEESHTGNQSIKIDPLSSVSVEFKISTCGNTLVKESGTFVLRQANQVSQAILQLFP